MGKGRLEAFSDGVIAIIITIMVLELKVPHGANLEALKPLMPNFLSYVLSFIYVGIYWNNHHHLLHAAKHVSGTIITAIGASFWAHWLAQFIYVLVALVWLVPDKRIERIIIQTEE